VNRGFRNGNTVPTVARTRGIGAQAAACHVGTRGPAKAELEKATRGIKSQLGAELDAARKVGKTEIAQDG